jgi:hypothetical protein
MLKHYLTNIPLGKRYIELNGIKRLVVCRHHLGGRNFQLWQTGIDTNIGTYETYKRKKDAIADARKMGLAFNLPVLIE